MSIYTQTFAPQTLDQQNGYKITRTAGKRLFLTALLSVFSISIVLGSELDASFDNNFYSLINHNFAQDSLRVIGSWQPTFSASYKPKQEIELQTEYSFVAQTKFIWGDINEIERSFSFKHYRYWLFAGLPQSSVRLGLQRLSLGSAQILRPLQWFDRIDPLDKSEETEGVKAALFKHNWLNNSNLWVWTVWGEDRVKGNELFASRDNSLEFGGRYQLPNPLGETAISYHQRELPLGKEFRLGLDHRYDGAIGAWIEASGSKFDSSIPPAAYSSGATICWDFTLGIANGLAFTNENMLTNSGNTISTLQPDNVTSALIA